MHTTIEVFARNVYGVMKIYPANDAAQTLAELVGKRTFDKRDLDLARKLGMVVEAVVDPKLEGVL
jgi:hypothetical protein